MTLCRLYIARHTIAALPLQAEEFNLQCLKYFMSVDRSIHVHARTQGGSWGSYEHPLLARTPLIVQLTCGHVVIYLMVP